MYFNLAIKEITFILGKIISVEHLILQLDYSNDKIGEIPNNIYRTILDCEGAR